MIDIKLYHKGEAVFVKSYNDELNSVLKATSEFVRSARTNIHIKKILMESEPTIKVFEGAELIQTIIIHKLR